MKGTETICIAFGKGSTIAPVGLEASASNRAGGLKTGCIDDAIDFVFDAIGDHAFLVIRSTPLAVLTSTSVTLGRLNVGRYSSLKVGRLQNRRYQGLRASATSWYDLVYPRANSVHLGEVRQLST
jgi:hypothetical protein